MSELIFSSEFYSISGVNYKVELTGETYTGLDTDIIGGSGFVWHVDKDWTDYLQNLQSIELRDQDEIDEVGTGIILGASVTSFSYNENEDRTEITLTTAFDSNFVRITSVSFFPSFDPDITSLETTWDKEDDIILEAIKASSTELTYSNNDAWFDRFFELFLRAGDDELKVQIFKDDGGFKREWVGNLVHDLMEYENTSKPRPYTFKVIDGIDMLKDVPYAEALTGASEQPLISHIITLLGYINTAQFWGSDPYIRESIEFTSNDVPGLGISDSPLEYTYLNDRHFIEKKEKPEEEDEPLDVYDSLRAILELMSCRIFQAKGIWWIQQIRNFANPTSVVFREFTNSIGAPSSQSQYNHKLTVGSFQREKDLVLMTSGTFRYLEGLLNVKLEAVNGRRITMNENAASILINSNNLVGTRNWDLGKVYGGLGSNARIRVECVVQEYYNKQSGYELECRLSIGTASPLNFITGGDAIEPFWSQDSQLLPNFWSKRVEESGGANHTPVAFETPEVPFTEEDFQLTMSFIYKGKDFPDEEYFLIKDLRIYFPDQEDTVRIDTGNLNTKYTKELDLGELIIDDFKGFVSVDILMVDDEFTTVNPRNLIPADTWDADFPEDERLTNTRVMEAQSFQTDAIEVVQITVEGEYYGFNSLSYNDKIYAFNGFRIDYLTDESEGSWFEVITARESIQIPRTVNKFPAGNRIPHVGGEAKGYSNNLRNNISIIATTDGVTEATGSDIGQIAIEATGHNRIKNGDPFQIVHSVTNVVFGDFVVDGDVGPTDTVMGIVEQTIEFDITDQMRLIFTKGEVVESNIVRSDNFIDKTTGGRLFVAGSNTEIQYNDNDSSGASPDFTWDDGLKFLGVNGKINLGGPLTALSRFNIQSSAGVSDDPSEGFSFVTSSGDDVGLYQVTPGVLRVNVNSSTSHGQIQAEIFGLDNSTKLDFTITNIGARLGAGGGSTKRNFITLLGSSNLTTNSANLSGVKTQFSISPADGSSGLVGVQLGGSVIPGALFTGTITGTLISPGLLGTSGASKEVILDVGKNTLNDGRINTHTSFWRTYSDGLTIFEAGTKVPTAVLHIRGRGTTNATKAFFVENDDEIALFEVLDNGEVLAKSFGLDSTTKLDFDISGIGARLQAEGAPSDTVLIDLVGANALTSSTSNLVGVRVSSVINASGGAFTSVGTQLGVFLIAFPPYTGDIIGTLISPAFIVSGAGARRVILDVGVNTGGDGDASTHTSVWSTHRDGRTIFGHPTNVPSATIDNFGDFVNSNVVVLADEATPSIAGTNVFKTGGTTTITDFDDGVVGKQIQILAKHTIIITDSVDIQLDGGTDFAMSPGNTLTLRMFDDQIWNEVGRV